MWRLAAIFGLAACTETTAQTIVAEARYSDPTTRYAHGILGDAIEHGTLELRMSDETVRRFVLPDTRVFEDTEPRLVDLGANPGPEIIVVESDHRLGARLVIFGDRGRIASTPFIGRAHRWLAPVGAADLDGDGAKEIAYVDRPHLAKVLRVWRFDPETWDFVEVGEISGVTNHRIGERDIAGGIRDCGDGPEMIVADAQWQSILAVQFDGSTFSRRDLGPHEGRSSFAAAMAC